MKKGIDEFLFPENLTLVLLTFKGYRTFLMSKHEGMSAQYSVGGVSEGQKDARKESPRAR